MLCKLDSFFYYLNKLNVVYKAIVYVQYENSCSLAFCFYRFFYRLCVCSFVCISFRLHDSETKAIVTRYEVSRIIFYFRGPPGSADQACFAFTFQTGETNDLNPLFQCYIFRCNIPEAVAQVSSKLCDFR